MIAINKIDRPNADIVSERTFNIDILKHLITYFAGMNVVLGESELQIWEFVASHCNSSCVQCTVYIVM